MAFNENELRNFSFKGWQGILGTANRSDSPDNFAWYEEFNTTSVAIHPKFIQSEIDQVPPAKDRTEAINIANNNPGLIKSLKLHCTPSLSKKTFFCTETFGDLDSRLYNFIMPQQIQRTDAGHEHQPSVGYAVRLYQGDPDNGGTEITTSVGQIGSNVGWFFMYSSGAVIVSSDFTIDPDDVWIQGFQYIGKTPQDQAEIDVDQVTINKRELQNYGKTGSNTIELFERFWGLTVQDQDLNNWSTTTIENGRVQMVPGWDRIFYYEGNNPTVMAPGDYEFYSTFKDPGGHEFYGSNSDNGNGVSQDSVFIGEENGLYRYKITIPVLTGDFLFGGFQPNDSDSIKTAYDIMLIDRTDPKLIKDLSATGINAYIKSDETSTEGGYFSTKDSEDKEVPTVKYMNDRLVNADEITLTKGFEEVPVSTENDINLVVKDAWDDTLPDTGWTLGDSNNAKDLSFNNGVFTLDFKDDNIDGYLIEASQGVFFKRGMYRILIDPRGSNMDLVYFEFEGTSPLDFYSDAVYEGNTSDGKWVYKLFVPEHQEMAALWYEFENAQVNDSITIELVKADLYPPKSAITINEIDHIIGSNGLSIDQAHVPMVNPDKELVTRSFVDTKQSQLEKITENNTGWRLLGRNPTRYGDIGEGAIDFSYSDNDSTTMGATGQYAFAEGWNTTSSSEADHAEGYYTTAEGGYGSHAEGYETIASGSSSHAEGEITKAEGPRSHAEGSETTAKGTSSHAEGHETIASKWCSHAEGQGTIASGESSHVEGYQTIALNHNSHAAGKYNVGTSTETIHETGIGADDTNRKNAFEIYTDGRVRVPELTNALVDNDRSVITKEYADANYDGSDSELEKITEGSNTGWRLLGADPDNYGDIGNSAIDLSYSNSTSTTRGATGQYAFAEGFDTKASGDKSHAEGYQTEASGAYSSHAEGYKSIASGENSHAEGYDTRASGDYGSHAEGNRTEASGDYGSHAEGYNTEASGEASHAEGYQTEASGYNSHAEGRQTEASGDHGSHAEGFHTKAINENSHAAGKYNVGTSTDTIHETGIGADDANRKNAFEIYTDGRVRVPELTNALVDNDRSVITKEYADANYDGSDSELEKITESGNTGWRLLGRDPDNYGDIGKGAVDLSYSNTASTTYGATGKYSTAEGYETVASGDNSHAEGYETRASGNYSSHAEGHETEASGDASHAEGYRTEASGSYGSHAEGYHTTAEGDYGSHAEGYETIASGVSSHAEGEITKAEGPRSHAEGSETTAKGTNSHSEGYQTIALNHNSHAAGTYNTGTATDTIHETGIGTDDSNRANAFEIYTDGRLRGPELNIAKIDHLRSLITKEYFDDHALTVENGIDKTLGTGGDFADFEELQNWLDTVVVSPSASIKITIIDGTYDFNVQDHGFIFKVPDFITMYFTASAKGNVTINTKNDNNYSYSGFMYIDFSANTKIENLIVNDTLDSFTHIAVQYQGITSINDCEFKQGQYGVYARMFSQVITHNITFTDISGKGIYSVEGSRVDIWQNLDITGPSTAMEAAVQGTISINGNAVVSITDCSYGIISQLGNSFISILTSTDITFTNIGTLEFGADGSSKIKALDLDLTNNSCWPALNTTNKDFSSVLDKNSDNFVFNGDMIVDSTVSDINAGPDKILVTKEWVGSNNGTETTEKFELDAQQVQDKQIDLQHIPNMAKHLFVYFNGLYLTLGTQDDYLISNETIQFNFDPVIGDKVTVKYTY